MISTFQIKSCTLISSQSCFLLRGAVEQRYPDMSLLIVLIEIYHESLLVVLISNHKNQCSLWRGGRFNDIFLEEPFNFVVEVFFVSGVWLLDVVATGLQLGVKFSNCDEATTLAAVTAHVKPINTGCKSDLVHFFCEYKSVS